MSDTRTDGPPVIESAGEVARAGGQLIWRFVRQQRVVFALATTGAIAFTAAIIVSAVVIGWVTDEVVVPVLADGEPMDDRFRTGLLLIGAVGIWKTVGIIVRRATAGWMQNDAQRRLRKELIAHELRLSLRWYGRRGVGDLLSVSDADTRQATFMLAPLPFATGVSALLVGSTVVIGVTDPLLGALALVLLATVVSVDLRGSWLTFAAMEEAQRRRGRVAEVAHESFDGALTVKALGREAVEVDRFGSAAFDLRDQLVRVGRTWTGYRAVSEGLPAIGTITILVVGTIRVANDGLTPGELVRVIYLLSLLAVPMRLIGYLMWDTAQSVAGWRRVEQVLDIDDTVQSGHLPAQQEGGADLAGEAVRFGYEPDTPVLHHLDVRVEPGRTVAVVGPTGSGKSTLALLLARLWDPDSGSVTLDGRDLRELAPGVVADEVAYVAQESFLFDDTVAGNVALGRPMDEPTIRAALRLAEAEPFVDQLPDALDTQLGERGTTLSGGQQQRIALARALARRPRLLVLDDATSAVDPSVEARILRGLRGADLPATVVVVAYRRASILQADEVIYLEEGRVVAHGRHERLQREVPGYSRLLDAYERDAAERAAEQRAAGEASAGEASAGEAGP